MATMWDTWGSAPTKDGDDGRPKHVADETWEFYETNEWKWKNIRTELNLFNEIHDEARRMVEDNPTRMKDPKYLRQLFPSTKSTLVALEKKYNDMKGFVEGKLEEFWQTTDDQGAMAINKEVHAKFIGCISSLYERMFLYERDLENNLSTEKVFVDLQKKLTGRKLRSG